MIITKIFHRFCKHFFEEDGTKKFFSLENYSCSEDPFVEYLSNIFIEDNINIKKSKPSSTPDLVFYEKKKDKVYEICGVEVKTSKNSTSGLNFNSTPPCGQAIIEINEKQTTIQCYYLIACIKQKENLSYIDSFALIDGNFINSDFDLYKTATGIREKKIDLGSYGDGIDRQRPFFVFPNPLNKIKGIHGKRSTLILSERIFSEKIGLVAIIERKNNKFYAYQDVRKLQLSEKNKSSNKTRERIKVELKL